MPRASSAVTVLLGFGAALLLVAAFSLVPMGVASAAPTCSDVLPIATHGQHIVGDYVTGVGHDSLAWPPKGGVVGQAVGDAGAALPGGPGPGFHFPNGVPPGASFCNPQAQSPAFDPRGP